MTRRSQTSRTITESEFNILQEKLLKAENKALDYYLANGEVHKGASALIKDLNSALNNATVVPDPVDVDDSQIGFNMRDNLEALRSLKAELFF